MKNFDEWLYKPEPHELVCENQFHETIKKVYEGFGPFDPLAPDPSMISTKVAQLLKAELVLLEGDVIYVRENDSLHPLNEATSLLAYYMHTSQKEALQAAHLLETNFQGYFPITQNLVWRDGIELQYQDGTHKFVNLSTLSETMMPPGYPEYGVSNVNEDTFEPISEYFGLINQAVGDEWFFEKMIMYPFTQPFREKSHVLVGGGGNGKSLFMKMVERLYGDKASVDSPQPGFKGHDAGVISYGFIGKKVVTFNDVGDPSSQFLEWLKRMITGNLEVKTPSGAWLSVPCKANFFMETNHQPQLLDIPAHRRRYVVRQFDPSFLLKEHMAPERLDMIGERGDISAADIVNYLMTIKDAVKDWTDFEGR